MQDTRSRTGSVEKERVAPRAERTVVKALWSWRFGQAGQDRDGVVLFAWPP